MAKKIEKNNTSAKSYSTYIIMLIIIAGFILYSNILYAPFAFDDVSLFSGHQDIRNDSVFTQYNQSRYIGLITFALNYKIHKMNTLGYHLLNILIHIANGIVVYYLVKKISTMLHADSSTIFQYYLPGITALLFLVHPIQTQAVTYISQRYTSLAALFALASILLYLHFRLKEPRRYTYYLLSILCALLAYKTKENTAMLPLVLAAIELFLFKHSKPALKQKVVFLIPYFLLIAVIIISFLDIHQPIGNIISKIGDTAQQTKTISRTHYLDTEFRVIATYIRLLLFPVNQSIDYYYPLSESFFEARTFFSFCLLMMLLLAAIAGARKFPVTAFGIFWFFLFLLIESSIIPIVDVIFEHRIYLPSIGFIMAFVYLLYNVFPRLTFKNVAITFIIIIIVLSIATYARNEIWKDTVTLWEDAVKKFPQKPRNHVNLGSVYAEKGRYDEAIKELETGIKNDQPYAQDRANLAYCYFQKGLLEQGIKWLNEAILLDPTFMYKYYEIATTYLDQQNLKAAFAVLNAASTINNSDFMITALLGRANCDAGNLDQALYFLDRTLQINNTYAEAYHDKGLCLFYFGKTKESRDNFMQCIQMRPDILDSYFYVAASYDKEGDMNGAAYYYTQFLMKSSGDNPLVLQAKERMAILSR